MATNCKTPGARYRIAIDGTGTSCGQVTVAVRFPSPVPMTRQGAKALQKDLHDAVEGVLAPLFGGDSTDAE